MPEQIVMVWIEDGTGTIARGQAESVSAEGACVRLAESPGFGEGAEVAVRICFEVGTPTVAVTAHVDGIGASAGGIRCDLRWTSSAEREFDAWPAHAA
jgi:hypothetical protein